MTELQAFAILCSLPGLGAAKMRLLLQQFGSALQALHTPAKDIQLLPGFERIAAHWRSWEKDPAWQTDLSLAAQQGIELVPFTSPKFPKSLLAIPDHPALLYVQGELLPQDHRCIAIVGTRHASIYGNEWAETISRDLAAQGFTIVSGLARGIDTAAHQGALSTGRTIAVIGSGLANIYPPENHALAQIISQKGALVSEFTMRTPPDKQNFPQRNRIVSGMTLATVLIEAPKKSGAMITAERAFLYQRKVFALPGRVDQENFQGNHLLIKDGKAQLIENAQDILAHFEHLFPIKQLNFSRPPLSLHPEENDLLFKMPNEEIALETLLSLVNMPIQQLLRILMSLVLKKAVKEYPGKIYKKLAAENTIKRHN